MSCCQTYRQTDHKKSAIVGGAWQRTASKGQKLLLLRSIIFNWISFVTEMKKRVSWITTYLLNSLRRFKTMPAWIINSFDEKSFIETFVQNSLPSNDSMIHNGIFLKLRKWFKRNVVILEVSFFPENLLIFLGYRNHKVHLRLTPKMI